MIIPVWSGYWGRLPDAVSGFVGANALESNNCFLISTQ
jgi:hypothetical protein